MTLQRPLQSSRFSAVDTGVLALTSRWFAYAGCEPLKKSTLAVFAAAPASVSVSGSSDSLASAATVGSMSPGLSAASSPAGGGPPPLSDSGSGGLSGLPASSVSSGSSGALGGFGLSTITDSLPSSAEALDGISSVAKGIASGLYNLGGIGKQKIKNYIVGELKGRFLLTSG